MSIVHWTRAGAALAAATFLASIAGCATSSESASKQQLTAHVGRYDAPPGGLIRPRTGIPPFESVGRGATEQLNEVAADQLTTLATNSDRFDVIERAQLNQLLREQGLEGIVKPDELAQSGKVRGVDFLLLGKVSNLRVKGEQAKRGFGVGSLPIPGAGGAAAGLFDFTRKDSTITAECGVDIRLVDATSGSVAAAQHSDYTRTDTIGAFGVEILGTSGTADADLQLDEDNKGLILRLALDDALRDMLPKVDKALMARSRDIKAKAAAEAVAAPGAPSGTTLPTLPAVATPAPAETAAPAGAEAPKTEPAKKFCSGCGTALAAGVKFCGGCGTKVE
jgi:curli biogenesis system outer membrane secretion channel CsgG